MHSEPQDEPRLVWKEELGGDGVVVVVGGVRDVIAMSDDVVVVLV